MSRWFALVLALGLTVAACAEEMTVRSGQDVVSAIPWAVPEVARYRLLDGDEVKGSGVLSIEARGDALLFSQSFQFPDPGIADEVSVETDATTLRPRTVRRLIAGPEGERHCQAEYGGGLATVEQRSGEGERTDWLTLPALAYDSWADLFLWRTLAFAEGYQVTYSDVLTCSLAKPQVLSVSLKVSALEMVSVPAGSFQTWRLEIRSGGRTQTAWYANNATRTLVRYDNGEVVFELESRD